MSHWRTGAVALVLSALSVGGILAAEAPGEESTDIPGPEPVQQAALRPGGQSAASMAELPPPMPAPADVGAVGPVTGLPLPRFLTMKTSRTNVRRGPSKTHRIDWEFLRRDMPVEVIAEYGHWRRIRDHDGMGGWVHYALLSGHRSVLVEQDMLQLRYRPDPDARVTAKLEAGVIADLEKCEPDWCRVDVSGYKGWAPKTALWGVEPGEIVD